MVPDGLAAIMKRLGLPYCVVVDMGDGSVHPVVVDRDLGRETLVNTLFGDGQRIENLARSLEGRLVPQSWRQGTLRALVCRPTPTVIVGFFYHEERNAVESYQFGQQVNGAVAELWRE